MKVLVRALVFFGALGLFAISSYRENNNDYVDNSISKSVVRLKAGRSVATGFAVKSYGHNYILTNHHVCDGFSEMQAENKGASELVTVLYSEAKTDLCLLTPMKDIPAVRFYPLEKMYGKIYKSLGHPFGFEQTISAGRYVQQEMMETAAPFPPDKCPHPATPFEDVKNPGFKILMMLTGLRELCLDITVMDMYNMITVPGNSGSPVYDGFGYVHGIISQTMSGLFGVAVSNAEIQGFLNRYEKTI